MTKRIFLLIWLGLIGTTVMAQDGVNRKLLTNPVLKEISALKDLANQISIAENDLATASRGTASKAQEKVNALYVSYEKELTNQKEIHSNDAKIVAAINDEIKLVNTK